MSLTVTLASRWKSAVCETQVVIVRPAEGEIDLQCGGVTMLAHDASCPADGAVHPDFAGGSLIGKRYADPETGLELLCSKSGAGSLAVNGNVLVLKEAKKLPSSD